MYSVNVSLGMRSYPIHIGQNYFIEPATFSPLKAGERALIVTNTTIAPYYLSRLESTLLQAGIKIETLVLPDGEQYKSLETLNIIFTELLKHRHGRDSTLIALGGGVIGDLVGFAAATYQRGIRFIQVPTTLLAQVDSSVGGKTGVNHSLGKNMVGAFYQPCTVVIDLNSLKTLPMREFSAGLAEVIKYGIILDNAFFVWLEAHLPELMEKNVEALGYCISRCCQIKADVVGQDEKEQGVRALLNLGHTFGHAIETGLGYGNWLHGEAVSVGMVMAANVAMQLDLLAQDDVVRIKQLLLKAGLPIERPPEMKSEDYLPYMRRDKKNITGKIRLVLPTGIGRSAVFDSVTDECIIAAIDAC